jgi:hypothetical protein
MDAQSGLTKTDTQRIKTSAKNAFQLLFVDPTGYTGFSPAALSIFSGRSSEIVVNFMRSFIVRFVSGNHRDREEALCGLLGRSRANKLLKGELSVETIETEYLLMLKEDLAYKYRYGAFSPIHNPDRNEIHFLLAYATNHPDGMEAMRSAEFTALTEHDKNRLSYDFPRLCCESGAAVRHLIHAGRRRWSDRHRLGPSGAALECGRPPSIQGPERIPALQVRMTSIGQDRR